LELRNKIRPKVIHVIGNGKEVSMWSDNWSDMGHLTQFVTYKDIHDARINEECSVADMIDDNKWIWPKQWVNKFTQLRNLHVLLLNDEKSDAVKWRKCNGQMIDFTVRDVWWDMKCAQDKVNWWKVIWFSQCNPRCAFILWLAVKSKLATQDHMMKWN
ncbi:reverse transcriptase zinc-binding domain-containing protein, partial [Tanacetum coccineum]